MAPADERLPFEPKKRKKKPEVVPPAQGNTAAKPVSPAPAKSAPRSASPTPKKSRATLEQTRIPDQVSRRMVSRIMIFSGIPTLLGISTFFASYLIVTREWLELPNVAVVLVSMGCFGLGFLGLSYGVLSASWEEAVPGSTLGWTEFQTNLQRFLQSWREFRQNNKSQSPPSDP
jgi:hypothetical protein